MKTLRSAVLTTTALLLLLGGANAAFAASTQPLSLTVPLGGVTNLGTQVYHVNGGQVAFAMIGGQAVDPASAKIQYNFQATQNGMSTTGKGSLQMSGMTAAGPVSVSGTFTISNIVAAAVIGESELPFFFVTDQANFQVSMGGSTQSFPETLNIESPYFNPFGAPIVIASPDGAIVIAATYTAGNILWIGSQVAGPVVGSLGTTPATGILSLTSGGFENLVQGTEVDVGSIQFVAMTPSSLDAQGMYSGSSTIPTAGEMDCSTSVGFPAGSGVCTETGFQSSGHFNADGIRGTYSTTWGVPALGFTSTISATVPVTGPGGNHAYTVYNQLRNLLGFF